MKFLFLFILLLLLNNNIYSRGTGETEITAEEGIEVYQSDKFYVLKKNVKIVSDDFVLLGDEIKIFFDQDMYDIKKINATGNVDLNSQKYNIIANGENLIFKTDDEIINIKGINSKLITNDTEMYSNGEINVNNIKGEFYIIGPNSSLKANDIFIEGYNIDGVFNKENERTDILLLNVKDDDIAFIKNKNIKMNANKIKYNKQNSLIELKDNVKIVRDGETITGDYGTLDTEKESYKIKSKESKRVKVVILDKDE